MLLPHLSILFLLIQRFYSHPLPSNDDNFSFILGILPTRTAENLLRSKLQYVLRTPIPEPKTLRQTLKILDAHHIHYASAVSPSFARNFLPCRATFGH